MHIDEGLIFGVAKNSGIGNRDGVGNGTGVDESGDEHVALQFFAGILGDDASLECAGGGIESWRDVGNFTVKEFGIGFSINFDRVADVDVGEIALVDVDKNPDGVCIGDGEALGCASLQ